MMRKNAVCKVLVTLVVVMALSMLTSMASASFTCSLVDGDVASGYCGLKFEVDKTVKSLSFSVSVPDNFELVNKHSQLIPYGSAYRFDTVEGKTIRPMLTYRFPLGLSYNPVLKVYGIQLDYKDGRSENLSSRSFTVPVQTEHTHEFSYQSTRQEATCSKKSIEIWECSCGEKQEREGGEYAPHSPGNEWKTIKEATCKEEGREELCCKYCDRRLDQRIVKLSNVHTPGEWSQVEEALCEQEGREEIKCRVCRISLETRVIPALGHQGDWQEIASPDCENQGEESRTCLRCRKLEVLKVKALGHELGDWVTENGLCTEQKEAIRNCLRPLCSHTERKIVGPLDGHNLGTWIDSPASCEKPGTRKRQCALCRFGEEEETEDRLGHQYGKWLVEKVATCEETGTSIRVCERSGCDDSQQRIDFALGHRYCSALEPIQKQSCLQEGIYVQRCQNEDCQSEQLTTFSALPHFHEAVWSRVSCETGGTSIRTCECGRSEEKEVPAGHDYRFDWKVLEPASCMQEGEKIRFCHQCGREEITLIERLPHDLGKMVLIEATVCGEADRTRRTCKHCPYFEEQTHEEKQHQYGEWVKGEGYSCELGGELIRFCEDCAHKDTQIRNPGAHRFSDWEVEQFSACDKAGTLIRKCEDCSVVERKEADKPDHVFDQGVESKTATCESEGEILYTCTGCGLTRRLAIGKTDHSYGGWLSFGEPSCLSGGGRRRECRLCPHVDTEMFPAPGHAYSEISRDEPECELPGKVIERCERCQDVRERTLAARKHEYKNWILDVPPVCGQDGSEKLVCGLCGHTKTRVIPALHHIAMNWQVKKEATCQEEGEESGVCKLCRKDIARAIPKDKHDFSPWSQGKCSDCSIFTIRLRTCNACSAEEQEIALPKQHVFDKWNHIKLSSCLESGQRSRSCKYCPHEENEELALATHRYGKWMDEKRDDCTQTGTRYRDCLDCGMRETGELKPRNHVFARWEVTRKATCSKQGQRIRHCKHCDFQEHQNLPLRKHRPGRWQVQIKATLDKPGLQIKACRLCGEILLRRPYRPGKQHFAVDFCVEGVILKDVWPNISKGWLSAVLVSLDQEGEHSFPLLAKGRDVVGEVLIRVLDEEMTVSYQTFGQKTEVLKERMRIFLPGDTLTMRELSSRRQGWKLNKPISIERHLKNAEYVLVFLRMDGIYDPVDAGKETVAVRAKDNHAHLEMRDQISRLFKFD